MNLNNRLIRILSVLIFAIGTFLGLALSCAAVWGDLEAHFFDVSMSLRAEKRLTTLKCPVLLTGAETGTVSATFTNTADRPAEFTILAHISEGFVTLMRESKSRLPLAPGENQTLEWPVTADDAAYGHLILVKVLQQYPFPALLGSCGILVVNLPYLSGSQLFVFLLAASLLSIAIGMGLWIVGNRPLSRLGREVTLALGVLAGSVAAGLIVSLLGWWGAGILALMATILLIGVIIGHFVNRLAR